MKILRVVFWFLIILFVAGVFLPQHFSVSRSVTVSGSSAQIHQLTNDLTQWPKWSPWIELEPSVTVTLGDITQGIGANQSWTDTSGGGRLLYTGSTPDKAISYNIWFSDNEVPAISTMSYATLNASQTKISWAIEGDMQIPVIGFYMALLMDKMIGPAFELGLSNIKREVEKDSQPTAD